jgi:hypothetical protein
VQLTYFSAPLPFSFREIASRKQSGHKQSDVVLDGLKVGGRLSHQHLDSPDFGPQVKDPPHFEHFFSEAVRMQGQH